MAASLRHTSRAASPFLALPGELRNDIYHLALAAEDDEHVNISLHAIKQRTALLRTCSQIRNEATEIFYNVNVFAITDCLAQHYEIKRFLRNAGKYTVLIPKLIVHIAIPKLINNLLLIYDLALDFASNTANDVSEAFGLIYRVMDNDIGACGSSLLASMITPSRVVIEREHPQYGAVDGISKSLEHRLRASMNVLSGCTATPLSDSFCYVGGWMIEHRLTSDGPRGEKMVMQPSGWIRS